MKCRRVDSDFGLSTSGKAGQQGEGAFSFFFPSKRGKKRQKCRSFKFCRFFLPCLEEEEEKAAAERGEGQHFAIDSCRVFCGKWIG